MISCETTGSGVHSHGEVLARAHCSRENHPALHCNNHGVELTEITGNPLYSEPNPKLQLPNQQERMYNSRRYKMSSGIFSFGSSGTRLCRTASETRHPGRVEKNFLIHARLSNVTNKRSQKTFPR
jgi:hypothetical protein